MSTHAEANAESRAMLQALLDVCRSDIGEWSPEDHRAILEHQLVTGLDAVADRLSQVSGRTEEEVRRIIRESGCTTFGDVLRAAVPSASALRMLKDFAKASLGGGGDLPVEVARVLYLLAIVRGRRGGVGDITSLNGETVEREARRCLTYGWLPDSAREQLRRALGGA